MFLGHFALGFAAKRVIPRTSLGSCFVAAQFIDLLWPTLLLLGLEQVEIDPGNTVVTPLNFSHYPYSHSLLWVGLWALLVGGGYYAWRRRPREALVLGLLVFSHWFLDLLVHRPDLPLTPNSERLFGLGLWSSLSATLLLELGLFVVGVALYRYSSEANRRSGEWGLWALVALLLAIYAANLFSPPPPSVNAIAWGGQAQWLLIAWAYWLDSRRHYSLGSRDHAAC